MGKEDQQIIVIERSFLFGYDNRDYFQGSRKTDELNYEGRILSLCKPMRRGDAEIDLGHKQPIGYMLVVNPHTKQVFAYQRSSHDEHYFEKRLQGKWSWGVGGHIEPVDGVKNPIRESMLRELGEEIDIDGRILDTRVLAYINDDTDDVGRVHFGVLYLAEIGGVARPKDKEMAFGSMMGLNELEEICVSPDCTVENWSRIAIEPLKEYFG